MIAQQHNYDVSQVLISWLMTHPLKIVPVVGSSKLERIQLAVEAVPIHLDREEWFMLLRASTGRDVA
jgi:predicted oxidoreductase